MKTAAIVTIGTEITDGQITNTNTQWLAQKLIKHHFQIDYHLSVPDSPEEMKKALRFAFESADLIFIAGGLGPTSDDITRDIVADVLSLPLELDTESWVDVQNKLRARNVIVRDGHKRQCELPRSATALSNGAGVAPGFYLPVKNKHLWVLPGPPIEIESIWDKHIEQQLQQKFTEKQIWALKTWLFLGKPESELAHETELFFSKYAFEKKLGYRLPVPYVEVKLWYPPEDPEALAAMVAFEHQMSDHFIAGSMLEVDHRLQSKLPGIRPITILDTVTSGGFLQRLTQALGPLHEKQMTYICGKTELQILTPESLVIHQKDSQWTVTWSTANKKTTWDVPAPSNKKSKWREAYFIEKVILGWLQALG